MHKPARTALGMATAVLCCTPLLGAPAAHASTPFVFRSTGAWNDVTDAKGNVWKAREGLVGGYGTSILLVGKPIALASDPKPYDTNTFGVQGYKIPVPAKGTYTVTLYMAEDWVRKAGDRVFNVDAEGERQISNVDIYAAVGFGTAYRRSFTVPVDDGELDLSMTAVTEKPLISAVEVTSADDTADRKSVV